MKNSVISISGQPVRLQVDHFDVYEQHDAFLESKEPDFVDWLVSQQLVVREPGVETVEADSSYLLWHTPPTWAEMQALRNTLPIDDYRQFKPHHLEVLATGYRQGTALDMDHQDYLAWLADDTVPNVLSDRLLQVINATLQARQALHVNKVGHTVSTYLPSEDGKTPEYCHTVGLSTKLGYELLLVDAGEAGTDILNWVAARLQDPINPLREGDVDEIDAILTDEEPTRVAVSNIDPNSLEGDFVINSVDGVEIGGIKVVTIVSKEPLPVTESEGHG